MFRSWTLPASLAPGMTNVFSPRMTLDGSILYIYDHHGKQLVAVRATNGKVLWNAAVPAQGDLAFSFTPLVSRNRVFVATPGFLHCYDAITGKHRWEVNTKGVPINGFARSKHHLFLPWINVKGTRARPGVHVWSIDSRRGIVEWNKKYPGVMAFLEGDSAGAYYVSESGLVLGLTPDRGEAQWQLRVKGRVLAPPILKSSRLYITTKLKKAGWSGTGLYAIDTKKGKLLWHQKSDSRRLAIFLYEGNLVSVDGKGQFNVYDKDGKRKSTIKLAFDDEPTSLYGTAGDKRFYVFSSHGKGRGYVWLVDPVKQRLLAKANALNIPAKSAVPAAKMMFMDGIDGSVYAYRLDRSLRPKRNNVPPQEFAAQMFDEASGAQKPLKALPWRLAGLGPKALPAIEQALDSSNVHVASAAARAIEILRARRSLPALMKAAKKRISKPHRKWDPMVAMIDTIALMRDRRAIPFLKKLMLDKMQGHQRRRAAYIALGAIGTTASLAPLWAFRAERQVTTTEWEPFPMTTSFDLGVESDSAATSWDEKIRNRTSLTVQTETGSVFTVSISPFLGGYNDIWIGKSDLSGAMPNPLFSGLTKPETLQDSFIRFKKLKMDSNNKATISIEIKREDKWISARPVTVLLSDLKQDADADGLPDIVEHRIQTCITHKDCDGDGIIDSQDVNPIASSKQKPTPEQELFQEAFFAYYAFIMRRGIVVVDPGDGPSIEFYGRRDPILSLRRSSIERLRKQVGLHAVDYVGFGGPYPEGAGSGDAQPKVSWGKNRKTATLGMDVVRSGDNAAAFNVTLKKSGKNWTVTRMKRIWSTDQPM